MIAILGSASRIGTELVKSLTSRGVPVRALSRQKPPVSDGRSPAESLVEHRVADAEDPSSLRRAFEGVDQLFFAMTNSLQQVELELMVVHLATLAGVKHLVKVSAPAFTALAPVEIARWHGKIEEVLALGSVPATVLRPSAFLQNLVHQAPLIQKRGKFYGVMGEAACNWVDVRDIADVAAEVLIHPVHRGQILTLTGPQAHSYPAIANHLSTLTGRRVRYVDQKEGPYARALVRWAGMPPHIARHLVEIQQMTRLVPEHPNRQIEGLLGRPARTLESFLKENHHAFA